MEQDKSPGKRVIDISTWSRRGNFEFFRDFVNPNLGVTVRVDVRHAYDAAKTNGVSFFLSYFYAILGAVNEIQEFHYRFDQEGNVVYYDRIDGLAPIRVEEKDNFAEMVFPFAEDFDTFCQTARQVIALAASTDPYEQAEAMTDYNVILVSVIFVATIIPFVSSGKWETTKQCRYPSRYTTVLLTENIYRDSLNWCRKS